MLIPGGEKEKFVFDFVSGGKISTNFETRKVVNFIALKRINKTFTYFNFKTKINLGTFHNNK
jgi:hypothetical protein